MTAVDPAPIKHRTKLFAAVAVAGLAGYKSTNKTLMALNAEVYVKPMMKVRIRGADKLTEELEGWICMIQPYTRIVIVPNNTMGNAI